jgi:GTP-binding protein HflX
MERRRDGRATKTAPGAGLAPAQAYGEGVRNPRARQRALCIAAGPSPPDLSELRELLRTAGVAVAGELTQRLPQPDPDRYFGKGKLSELKRAIADSDANLVASDDELLPRQERNLEQELGVPVIDRTAIILDIFADHAHSAEGKLQVELAQLEYNLARMRGLWTHLERLGGGIGTRGPGETQIETDRRLVRDRIAALKRRLRHTRGARRVMRRERDRAGLPSVALAGYTNAGKSTLLNALTGADVGVRERLFHTLDPTTRSFRISGRSYLMTDTVGFIRKLPHELVEAFAATLEETLESDLIVHVADASVREEELREMIDAVEEVLATLEGDGSPAQPGDGAAHRPRLLALNKVDLLSPERRRELSFRFPGALQVSAETGEGLKALRERIEACFLSSLHPMELVLPYEEGGRLSELHELAGEIEREDGPEGVRVRARVPAHAASRFERFAVDGSASAPRRGSRPE